MITRLKASGLSTFKVSDAARLTGKSKDYVYLILSKSKRFHRVQNGIYYIDGAEPLAIASSIVPISYISLASAFSYYGLIDQIPKAIKVITIHRHKPIGDVQGMRVEFKTVKRKMIYGYGVAKAVSIAEPEKAIVDSLYLNEDTRYLQEVLRNATASKSIDADKLMEYAKRSGVGTVIRKAKSLLEAI